MSRPGGRQKEAKEGKRHGLLLIPAFSGSVPNLLQSRPMTRRNLLPIWAALSLLAYGGLVLLDRAAGSLRGPAVPQTILLALLAFAAYGAALWSVERRAAWPARLVWITAVLARLLLLFAPPTLSDDVYRLIWDGHLALSRVSPYAYAVADPALDALTIPARALVNNPDMASPYLPAAQAFFAAAAALALDPLPLQLLLVLADLLAAAVIAALLRRAALPPRRLLLYLWNPLIIIEVAHGAHVDAWMALLALLAVWSAVAQPPARRGWLSPLFLALGTLTKPLPALLAPALFWRWTWPQRLFYPALTAVLLLPFGLWSGWGLGTGLDGRGLFGALLIYTSRWKFNSGLFAAFEALLGGPDSLFATTAAKLLSAALLLLVLLAVWRAARRHTAVRDTLRLAAAPLLAYILLTPTFHPWYLVLPLAFLPFLPPGAGESRRWWLVAAPWLWLSATAFFSYLAYLDPALVLERPWVRALQWLPALALCALAAAAFWRARPVIDA